MGTLDRLPRVSPATYRRITLLTLASLVIITLAGVTVRLTDSGMGCSTWPSCEPGSFTPRPEAGIHGMIEFGNRLMSGLVGLAALAAVYGAVRRSPRRNDLVHWSWQVFGWVVLNALVGRFVIEHHLLPTTVIIHFLLAMVAIWSAVVLHHKAAADLNPIPGQASEHVTGLRRTGHLLVFAAVVTIVVGTVVTGSGPHAGDQEAERLALDVGEVARIHGVSAVVFLLVALRTSWLAHTGRASTQLLGRLRWLTLILIGQGVIGYIQYFSGVPPLLVGAHVLGAALAWIMVLRVWLALPSTTQASEPLQSSSAVETRGSDVRDWKRCPVPQSQSR